MEIIAVKSADNTVSQFLGLETNCLAYFPKKLSHTWSILREEMGYNCF